MSAVSGRCVRKTRRHVFKTNFWRHQKYQNFQLRKSFHFNLSKPAGACFRGRPSSSVIGNQSNISTRFLCAKKKVFAGWPTHLQLPTRTTYLALIIWSISQKICYFGLPSPIHQDLNHFRRLMNNARNVNSTRSSRLCYSDGNIHPAAHCSSRQGSYAPGGQCHSASKQLTLLEGNPPMFRQQEALELQPPWVQLWSSLQWHLLWLGTKTSLTTLTNWELWFIRKDAKHLPRLSRWSPMELWSTPQNSKPNLQDGLGHWVSTNHQVCQLRRQ